MASVTLTAADRFPAGTSVSAYLASNWLQSQLPPTGAPQGAAAATASVAADGSLTFTGLADDARYYAYAQVGGQDRYVKFSTLRKGIVTNRVILPNVTITDEANGVVNAVQFGDDGTAPKDQHLSTADRVGATGSGAGMTVNPGAAEGTNQAGASLRLGSGISTGNNGSGAVAVVTSTAGASGVQQNTQSDSWYFWGGDLSKALTPASNDSTDLGFATTLRIRDIYAGALKLREGANAASGAATLVAGTVVVATTKVTANSRIQLTGQDGSVIGALRVNARVVGTSFTISSSNAGDSGVVAWQIVEPA